MKSLVLLAAASGVLLQACSTPVRAPAGTGIPGLAAHAVGSILPQASEEKAYCADLIDPGWDWHPDQDVAVREEYLRIAADEYPAPKWEVSTKRIMGVTLRTQEEVQKSGLPNPSERQLDPPRFRVVSIGTKEVEVEAAGDRYKMKNVRSAEYVRRTAEHQARVTAWKRELGYTEGHEDLRGAFGRGDPYIADVLSSPKKVARGDREMGPDYFTFEELVIWSQHSARSEHHQPVLMTGEKPVFKENLAGVPQAQGVHVSEIGAKHAVEIAVEKIFDIYDAVTDTHRSYRAPAKDLAEVKKIIGHELTTRIEKSVAQVVVDFLERAKDVKDRAAAVQDAKQRLRLVERWINRELSAVKEAR